MEQSINSATNVYQTPRDIIVHNNFALGDPLIWARAFAACAVESMAFFDEKMRLILWNNKFGTLDNATQRDLTNLDTLFRYYGKSYSNAPRCLKIVKEVFLFMTPRSFDMHNHSGRPCHCKACPVLEGMQLRGVVLLAHRDERSALPIGERIRAQRSTRI